jgi:integrase
MARRGRRGTGTVYFSRTDGCWFARWPLGIIDGKRRAKKVRCRTEDEGYVELDNLRRLYAAGGQPFTGTLGEYLKEWLPAHSRSIKPSTKRSYDGHIFVTPAGAPPHKVGAELDAACKRLKLPRITPHELRHASLTILADAGVPEDVRERRAGHSTPAMARKYTSQAEVADQAAAEVMQHQLGQAR